VAETDPIVVPPFDDFHCRSIRLGHLGHAGAGNVLELKAYATGVPVTYLNRHWLLTAHHFLGKIYFREPIVAFFKGEPNTIQSSHRDVFLNAYGNIVRGGSGRPWKDLPEGRNDLGFLYVARPESLTRRGFQWTPLPESGCFCPTKGQRLLACGFPKEIRSWVPEANAYYYPEYFLDTVLDQFIEHGFLLSYPKEGWRGPRLKNLSGLSGAPVWAWSDDGEPPKLAGIVQSQWDNGFVEVRDIASYIELLNEMSISSLAEQCPENTDPV
jgi:hypothetical protein